MIKFFRNIRKQLLGEGKTGNYFKYAIGEILLVMIGILLALQVNNWNTNNTTNDLLIDTFKKIKIDLENDIRLLTKILKDGELQEANSKAIISRNYDLNDMTIRQKRRLFHTGLSSNLFSTSTAGYDKLNAIDGVIPEKYMETIDLANYHFITVSKMTQDIYKSQFELIQSRHNYLENNEAWYANFRSGGFSKEAEAFFTKNPIYLNWIVRFKSDNIAKKNWVLQEQRASSLAVLLRINTVLGISNESIHKLVKKVPEECKEISGNYYSDLENKTFNVEIIDGFLLMDQMIYTHVKDLEFKSAGFDRTLKFSSLNSNPIHLQTNDFFDTIKAIKQDD